MMNVHDHLKNLTVEEIKEVYERESLPFSVCCLNITGDLNVGMIIRTACVFGARKAYVLGRRKYDKRTTVGAYNYIPVERIECLNEDGTLNEEVAINAIGDHTIVSLEQPNHKDHFIDIEDFSFSTVPDPCIVFGNEGDGISENFLMMSDYRVYIPQLGVIRSLNVSNAAAIAIHEAYRSYK